MWRTAPRPTRAVAWVAAVVLVAAGCGGAIPSSNGGSLVRTMSTKNGTILVDGAGHTLYVFARDARGESYCTGACAAVWPPYEPSSSPRAAGMPASALGTIKRADGEMQVTFDGHPLYYYAGDASTPGKTTGEELNQFGAAWYLVAPNGKPVAKGSSNGGYNRRSGAGKSSGSTRSGGYGNSSNSSSSGKTGNGGSWG
jgi:predicted lipoprotein with Yx(FWY)xxD motif